MRRFQIEEQKIDKAVEAIVAAYWEACDKAQAAVDPSEVASGYIEDLLHEQYSVAMDREAMVQAGKVSSWAESGEFF